MLRFLIRLLFLGFILAITFPGLQTNAHSNVEKTFPENGAKLVESPQMLEVWFQDPVQIHSNTFVIKNEDGKQFETKRAFKDKENKGHIIASLDKTLPPGKYKVEINTIALDGYVSKEFYRFEVVQKEQLQETIKLPVKLLKASPTDGEVVNGTVQTLHLWFNQPVKMSAVGVFDDKKRGLTIEEKVDPNDPNHVVISFDQEIKNGTYQVSWFAQPINANALSERMGVFYFTVNEFTAINPPQPAPNIDWFANINVKQMSYWIVFTGFSLLFGLSWFNQIINTRPDMRKWKNQSYFLIGLAVIGEVLFLQTLRAEIPDLPFAEFLLLKLSWISLVQLGLLFLGLIIHKWSVYVYGISLVLFPFVVGHASYPRYGGLVAMGVNAVHLLAIAIWLGGLFALITMAPKTERLDWLKTNARKFSKWALGSVVLVVLTGLWMTYNFVPTFSAQSFIQSVWGRTIIIKIVLLLIMVMLAYFQQKGIRSLSDKFIKGFNIRLYTEFLYGMMILFFAGILVVSTPGAAEQGVYPKELTKDGINLGVEISPLYPGHNEFTLTFDKNSNIKNVTVKLSMPPNWQKTNRAFKVDDRTFKLTGMNLHAAGTTYMEVKAEKDNGDEVVYPFKIVIPGEVRFNE